MIHAVKVNDRAPWMVALCDGRSDRMVAFNRKQVTCLKCQAAMAKAA